MINVLRTLILKVNNMQEQMDNISRENEILRKIQKETQVIKNVTEMRDAFYEQIKEGGIRNILLFYDACTIHETE